MAIKLQIVHNLSLFYVCLLEHTKFKSLYHFSFRLCHTGAKNRQRKIVTKFVIRCVCHTEGLKSWQIMKKMTHKNLKIVKKLVHVPDI